jgi:GNAT superfamily N-acetyltransferase
MTSSAPGVPSLRPARAGDAPAVAAIWAVGWRDGHFGNVPEELVAVRTPESFRSRAAERLADPASGTVGRTTVAEVDGEVVGFVMVVGDEVEQVYVAPGHRGTGLASLLLDEAERLVVAGGFSNAWLAVVPGNARARRFYERRGWRDDGGFSYAATAATGLVPVPCRRYVKELG